jgi:hypothetical protein
LVSEEQSVDRGKQSLKSRRTLINNSEIQAK